jgi:hypothetical protein
MNARHKPPGIRYLPYFPDTQKVQHATDESIPLFFGLTPLLYLIASPELRYCEFVPRGLDVISR